MIDWGIRKLHFIIQIFRILSFFLFLVFLFWREGGEGYCLRGYKRDMKSYKFVKYLFLLFCLENYS